MSVVQVFSEAAGQMLGETPARVYSSSPTVVIVGHLS